MTSSDDRMEARIARRGSGTESMRVSSPNRVFGPLTRTTATPDGGSPLDKAKMVAAELPLPVATASRIEGSP